MEPVLVEIDGEVWDFTALTTHSRQPRVTRTQQFDTYYAQRCYRAPRAVLTFAEVYADYETWRRSQDPAPERISRQFFSNRLWDKDNPVLPGAKNIRHVHNIGLRPLD